MWWWGGFGRAVGGASGVWHLSSPGWGVGTAAYQVVAHQIGTFEVGQKHHAAHGPDQVCRGGVQAFQVWDLGMLHRATPGGVQERCVPLGSAETHLIFVLNVLKSVHARF